MGEQSGVTPQLRVTAVIPTHDRPETLTRVLERLVAEPIDEIVVVDNGSSVDLGTIVEAAGGRLARLELNTGVTARNVGAELASGDLLLMLDDDSYPLPGAVAQMRDLFAIYPGLAAVGGKVIDVDGDDQLAVRTGEEVGSFDWFSTFEVPPARDGYGVLAFFAAEGACMIRRVAHLQVGGFFEPYFRELGELDLATRLLGAGWDVRYLPTASFNHLRSAEWRMDGREHLRLRVRNNIWYFWRHFPAPLAVRRIGAYAAFDFIECAYRGLPGAWVGGVADAWRQRGLIQGTRQPLGRGALQRIELSRGPAHAALLRHAIASRVSRAG